MKQKRQKKENKKMDDFFKNLFKGLLYIGGPVALGLAGQYLTNKRENEVFELRVHEEVKKQLREQLQMLEAPKES